jgi:hypothetical protein
VADLSDVTTLLYTTSIAAVYPNGTSSASVGGIDCRIFEGWPDAAQLDLDLSGKMMSGNAAPPITRPGGPLANVSIFPMQGTGIAVYQILDETYVIKPVSYGLSVATTGNLLTVTGQPNPGEYITIVADDMYVYSSNASSTAAMLAALATAAQVNYPSAASTATTLTIPTTRAFIIRQGGFGTLGKVTHRQRHPVMVTVWAPTQASRTAFSKAIDVAIKNNNKVTMPDGSQALVIYSRTNVSDDQTAATVYRRDLIYMVEYATVETFPGAVVTTVNNPITAQGIGSAIATALT